MDVRPEGWGVGAGAIGDSSTDAVDRIVDSTFLFSTVFISPHPSRQGTAATQAALHADGLAHFAPTMTWFTGDEPDLRYAALRRTTQARLLTDTIWPSCDGAAALGVVALVEVCGADFDGALIRTSVAKDGEAVPTGRITTDPDVRARFFDLRPLERRPRFTNGLAWFVAVSIRHEGDRPAPAEACQRMVARPPGEAYTHHCHVVLVEDAPAVWREPTPVASWPALRDAATASVLEQAEGALAIHSDDTTLLRPLTAMAWSFAAEDIQILP